MNSKIILFVIVIFSIFLAGCTTVGIEPNTGCSKELQVCPDGTSVGRVFPSCDFAPCPNSNNECKKDTDCMKAGCSGQLCIPNGPVPATTCEFKPEYTCYGDIRNCQCIAGSCGWDEDATTCVKNYQNAPTDPKCNWSPGMCAMVTGPGYSYNIGQGECVYTQGGGCTPPPFSTMQECQQTCKNSIKPDVQQIGQIVQSEINKLLPTSKLVNRFFVEYDNAKTYTIWLYAKERPTQNEMTEFGTPIATTLSVQYPDYFFNFNVFPKDSIKQIGDTLPYDLYANFIWRNQIVFPVE